ncbi:MULTISPECIES: N-acetylglutaminylglutamine synthetase [Gammaproteobacteria]|uniref:N-acetylglutaminylglutamine synthetase n=1 Tax=Candidatus Macondimonas diazotrophica TaxID=2305248 RepID=A0A4Z0FDB2_9GAMM|nr:N-acetylglutaminylglutamine synthetase [Candidatus Macondimonas diazotrophica]TFZ84234.1 N-acetylglutaminylglutamine synthetase [Candidatus Macondimonas diazotrophica]HCZ48615.1 N-acetylglutaminylglutamine synthetase [Gammaproteobacteria bacterium]MCH78053.1 N-acetylglutaminylglutamine synthetase [Gammaproteobacteria bacterium]
MSNSQKRVKHRLERGNAPSLRNWDPEQADSRLQAQPGAQNVAVECGWGRVIFGQTFPDPLQVVRLLESEKTGHRDIAIYLREPHVVTASAPNSVFLDPSHTYRLWLYDYRPAARRVAGLIVRRLNSHADAQAAHDLYCKRGMLPPDPDFIWAHRKSTTICYLVAEHEETGKVLGVVMGVDHVEAFGDPENGASLWALVADPQAPLPGVGEALTRQLAEFFQVRGRAFMDLSVMHDNRQAIRLYEKLGFQRVPVFCLKHKNSYNEPLFVGPQPNEYEQLNVYARIIVDEAARRGIGVNVIDAEGGYFELTYGGRSVLCRESLSELTSAVAMSVCDDKLASNRFLRRAGLRLPQQCVAGAARQNRAFLERHGPLVVKPARGEQGRGITVDVRDAAALTRAVRVARRYCDTVLLEELVPGDDLRVVVIDFEVVAAAVRRPPQVFGTGQATVRELIEKLSRRRLAASAGESHIPLDDETARCVRLAGYELDQVLPSGVSLQVRKTANLHTGGTLHDVTDSLHPTLADAAVQAARALNIPVVGLDFLVTAPDRPEHVIIEANERPGLANHEPQPTAQRFVDLLFPITRRLPAI